MAAASRFPVLPNSRAMNGVAFAGAMTELRQAVITKWFLKQRQAPEEDKHAAHTESDKRGAAADHARLRVQMLTDDIELLRLVDAAFKPIGAMHQAPDLAALKQHEEHSQTTLSAFIQSAGRQVRGQTLKRNSTTSPSAIV